MKTTQILALMALSLGFLSTVQAVTEVFNNTHEPLAVRATYKKSGVVIVASLEPDEIVDIKDGIKRIEIYPGGGDLGANVLRGVRRAEHRSQES